MPLPRCRAAAAAVAAALRAPPGAARSLSGARERGCDVSDEGLRWLAGLVNYEAAGMPRQVDAPAAAEASVAGGSEKFDLSRMRALLAALGDPQARVPIVHVAGTKGKGSVAAMLAAMLRAAGLRVGVYTSPHLHTIRERIQTPSSSPRGPPPIISDVGFARLASEARAAAAALPAGDPPSHFEAVTAMAFHLFAREGADIAVVETGMGGATDATNVAPAEALQAAVITPIGWDHVEALGGSLESIAAAKAGIMRPGRPAVIAPQPHAAAAAVLAACAAAVGADAVDAAAAVAVSAAGPLHVEPGPGWHLARQAVDVEQTADVGPAAAAGGGGGAAPRLRLAGVEMALVGAHQRANAATAVAAALRLRAGGWRIGDDAVAEGLRAAALPGRFQVARLPARRGGADGGAPQPYVVLDGAHTPESAAALAAALREAFPPPAPLALVVGMAGDKEHREVAAALRRAAPGVAVFTSVPVAGSSQRSAQPGTLVAHWQAAALLSDAPPFRCRELVQGGMHAALPKALSEVAALARAAPGGEAVAPGVVAVTGSLHAVAAATHELETMADDAA